MKKIFILLFLAVALSSCASPYIGQFVKPNVSFPKDNIENGVTGFDIARTKYFIVEFHYKIDKGIISFDGVIRCNNLNLTSGEQRLDLDIDMLFVNKAGLVMAHEHFKAFNDDPFCGDTGSPKEFKVSYPFDDGYSGVLFGGGKILRYLN